MLLGDSIYHGRCKMYSSFKSQRLNRLLIRRFNHGLTSVRRNQNYYMKKNNRFRRINKKDIFKQQLSGITDILLCL